MPRWPCMVMVASVVGVSGGCASDDAGPPVPTERGRGLALTRPRAAHRATPLGDGRVLVVGGGAETEGRDRLASTELLDLRRGTVQRGPSLGRGEYKLDGAVARLADGRVIFPTGDRLDVFDPDTERITELDTATDGAQLLRTVTPIGPDRVLLAGGYDDSITPTRAAMVVRIRPSR